MRTAPQPSLTVPNCPGRGERRVLMGEVPVAGGRRALRVAEADPDGAVVAHARVPDRPSPPAKTGLLTPPTAAAGGAFAKAFHQARRSILRCSAGFRYFDGRNVYGRASFGCALAPERKFGLPT